MTQAQPTFRVGGKYTNMALTAIAVLLGLNLLKPVDFVQSAWAQPADERTNAAEQRKQIIAELASIEKKIERVEAQMTKGIKVSEMPELKLPAEMKEALKAAARSDKSDKGEKPGVAPAAAAR